MSQIPHRRAAIFQTMKQATFIALEGVIQKLFESAVNNVQDVINETEDLEFFDSDKLMQEADYIDNLQRVKGTLDDAKENDEIESLEPNLKFLKGDFSAADLVDMLGEGNLSELSSIWELINGKGLLFEEELDAISDSHLPVYEAEGIWPMEVIENYINEVPSME